MSDETLLGGIAQADGAGSGSASPWHGAPETYGDFKLPPTCHVDPDLLGRFHERARHMNLSQHGAQALVDVHLESLETLQRLQHETLLRQQQDWIDAVRRDPEIGGPHMHETLSFAAEAIRRFGSPELREALETTGLGNHPELIRFFVRVGRAVGEGSYVTAGRRDPRSAAQVLYPNMK